MQPPSPYVSGDALVFIDDIWSAVMVTVVDGSDPAELLAHETRRLATALTEFAEALDRHYGMA